MPILIKKLDGSIISYFGADADSDFAANVVLVKSVIGEVGIEDYMLLSGFEAYVQNFSAVYEAEFCQTTPTNSGINGCSSFTNLNISY